MNPSPLVRWIRMDPVALRPYTQVVQTNGRRSGRRGGPDDYEWWSGQRYRKDRDLLRRRVRHRDHAPHHRDRGPARGRHGISFRRARTRVAFLPRVCDQLPRHRHRLGEPPQPFSPDLTLRPHTSLPEHRVLDVRRLYPIPHSPARRLPVRNRGAPDYRRRRVQWHSGRDRRLLHHSLALRRRELPPRRQGGRPSLDACHDAPLRIRNAAVHPGLRTRLRQPDGEPGAHRHPRPDLRLTRTARTRKLATHPAAPYQGLNRKVLRPLTISFSPGRRRTG